ncbi:MAG: hypothetical protein ACE5I1_11915 [bacterium]
MQQKGQINVSPYLQRNSKKKPPKADELHKLWTTERGGDKIDYEDRDEYGDCFKVATEMAVEAGSKSFNGKYLYHKGSHERPKGSQAKEAYSRGWGKKFKDPMKSGLKPRFDYVVKIGSAHYMKIYEGEYVKDESKQPCKLVELLPGMLIYTAEETAYCDASKTNLCWELRHQATYYKDGKVFDNFLDPKKPLRALNDLKNWESISAHTDYDRSKVRPDPRAGYRPRRSDVTGTTKKKIGQFSVVLSIYDPYHSGRLTPPKVKKCK